MEETASTNRMPMRRSVSCIQVVTGPIVICGPNGMTEMVISFTTSAKGCSNPCGPTRYGPTRSWTCAITLRSIHCKYARVVRSTKATTATLMRVSIKKFMQTSRPLGVQGARCLECGIQLLAITAQCARREQCVARGLNQLRPRTHRHAAIHRRGLRCSPCCEYGQRNIITMHVLANLFKNFVGGPHAEVDAHFLGKQAQDFEIGFRAHHLHAAFETLHFAANVGDRPVLLVSRGCGK